MGFDFNELDVAHELAVLAMTVLGLAVIIVVAVGLFFICRYFLRKRRQ